MRRGGFLAVAVLSLACRDPRVNGVSTEFLVQPESLDFGAVSRGARVTLALRVTNQGRAAVEVEVEVEVESNEPISASGSRIGGGIAEDLPVTFQSLQLGPHEGALRVSSGAFQTSVRWTALVVAPAACASTPACQESALALSGDCVLLPAPAQQPCSLPVSACGIEGRCQQGACVPSITGCDDGNACTRDQCDATLGCTHDVAHDCPSTSDPCLSTTCDPAVGCLQLAAREGAACGPSSCTERRVCRAGSCVGEPTPEGTACLEGSPCQQPGSCRAGTCDAPGEAPLTLRWERAVPNFWNGVSPAGVTDVTGKLYWVECLGNQCQLLGAELDGRIRFAAQVEELERLMVFGPPSAQHLLLVTSTGRLQVRSLLDGSLEWELDLAPVAEAHLTPSQQDPIPYHWLGGIHAVANESAAWISLLLQSPVWGTSDAEQRGSALIAVDLQTHEVRWSKGGGSWGPLVLDDEGVLHANQHGDLVSYTADGAERYRNDLLIDTGLWGTVGPRLLVDDGLYSTADGSLVRTGLYLPSPEFAWSLSPPVASASSLWKIEHVPEETLERISLVDGRLEWRVAVGAHVQNVALRVMRLTGERALVNARLSTDGGLSPGVVGFEPLGNRWSCGFPGLAYGGVLALADGLLYVIGTTCESCGQAYLRAYEFPGVAPATDGWAHYDGDFGRSRGDTF